MDGRRPSLGSLAQDFGSPDAGAVPAAIGDDPFLTLIIEIRGVWRYCPSRGRDVGDLRDRVAFGWMSRQKRRVMGDEELCASSSAIWPWCSGDAGGEPPASVAAVPARWVGRLELLEIELGDRLQLLRQPRSFEIGREIVQQGAVFVLHRDDRGDRRCPPPGPVSLFDRSTVSSSRPAICEGGARSRGQGWLRAKRGTTGEGARGGLDDGEHRARLGRVGGSAIMPPAAVPPFCARANRPCRGSDAARAFAPEAHGAVRIKLLRLTEGALHLPVIERVG